MEPARPTLLISTVTSGVTVVPTINLPFNRFDFSSMDDLITDDCFARFSSKRQSVLYDESLVVLFLQEQNLMND